MSYSLLHSHSQYSLLNGLSEPKKIVKHAANLGIGAVALTDISSVSGVPQFLKAAKKEGVKPILGCEVFISEYGGSLNLIALNKNGWKSLIKIVSHIHTSKKFVDGEMSISMEALKGLIVDCNSLCCVIGAPRSIFYNQIFLDSKNTCNATLDKRELKSSWVKHDWVQNCKQLIGDLRSIFGRESVMLEAVALDSNRPAFSMNLDAARYIAKVENVPILASTDSRYCDRGDAADFRTVLCLEMDTTLEGVAQNIQRTGRGQFNPFFDSYNYYIPTIDQLKALNTEAEIAATNELASRVEIYDIIPKQSLPTFPCPNNFSQHEYLVQLCRDGWKRRNILPEQRGEYGDRVKKELGVFEKANLSSYFLIVQDYVNAARSRGELAVARGSGAGCLVSYLIGINDYDPLPYDLLFERFYNEGRNTKDHVSMPDIDMDFPANKRQNTFNYIRDKYGRDKVSQIATFLTIKGKGAVKAVMRTSGRVDNDLMNKMTEKIPEEAAISDQLQEMQELTGESGILLWALRNYPEDFAEWVVLKEDGSYEGEFSKEFSQAIRLEGTRTAYGKHAAGCIISDSPLADICPVYLDKSGENTIVGFEFKELEELGFVKFDILGVRILDKMIGVDKLLNGGDFEDE